MNKGSRTPQKTPDGSEAMVGRVTIEDMKHMDSFAGFNDEQCQEVLDTIETFCDIVFSIIQRQEAQQQGKPQ